MNQKMLELLGEQADKYPKNLEEKFARIFNKIIELWGTAELVPYFDDLMMSARPNRQGFPPDVVKEIWALHKIFMQLFPEFEPPGIGAHGDIWSGGGDVGRDIWKP